MPEARESFTEMSINVGSSSIKSSIYNGDNRVDININFIGLLSQTVRIKFSDGLNAKDEAYRVSVGDDLIRASGVVISKAKDILDFLKWTAPKKIGHRVKFAGFGTTVEEIKKHQEFILEFNDYLSSRHNSLCLAVIQETKKTFPKAMQLMVRDHVVDDLSLHSEERIPFQSSIIKRYGLYSSGYHGLAIKACLKELKNKYKLSNYTGVICQIGSGVSVSAVHDGKVHSNSMQFAACDGPVMHNRSCTQPMGLALRMLKYGLDAKNLSNIYSRRSGVYGLANLPPNSDVTVENILCNDSLKTSQDAYLLSSAIEIFKVTTVAPNISTFVFSGGLATKHKWIAPELLYRAKVINLESKKKLTRQFENNHVFVGEEQGVKVFLVDIDEQNLIRNIITDYQNNSQRVSFFAGVCEVPGTSIGIVKVGANGWGKGNISLNFSDSIFSFNKNYLPEAFIFFGKNRNEFFLRTVFARVMKVPAFFIEANDFDISSIINTKIFLDTPTRVAIKL